METDDTIIFRVAGEGGEGTISCGEILALAASRAGLGVYMFRSYPAEIKGGPAMFQVRVGRELILSQGTELDVLVCFNQENYDLHIKDLKKRGGVLVYDSSSCVPRPGDAEILYGFPASEMARQELRSYLTKNILFLGVLCKLFNFPYDKIEGILKTRFAKKGEAVLNLNLQAFKRGYDYAGEHFPKTDPYSLSRNTDPRYSTTRISPSSCSPKELI